MPDYIADKLNGMIGIVVNVYKSPAEYPIKVNFLNSKDRAYAQGLQETGFIYKEEELEWISEDEVFVGLI